MESFHGSSSVVSRERGKGNTYFEIIDLVFGFLFGIVGTLRSQPRRNNEIAILIKQLFFL